MATGDSADILGRVKRLIPKHWFNWTAPLRDAVMGGLSDSAAWGYSLIGYARTQTRLATATGIWLDLLSYDFLGRYLPRKNASDGQFRARIRATILQERVTRPGMVTAVVAITGRTPKIFEPWNTFDTGSWGGNTMGYGQGNGGYGSMALQAQAFLTVQRGALFLAPYVAGYGSPAGGYGVGTIEYISSATLQAGVEDAIIYSTIVATKPTGVTCWTRIT